MEETVQFKDRELLYNSIAKDLHLKKIDEVFYPHVMGNYIVTFSAGGFLIQYAMDRSQLFISIASNRSPTRWIDLSFIKNYINQANELNPAGRQFDLKEIMESNDFLKNNFDKIAKLLNKDNYKHTFGEIDAQLKSEFMRRYPGTI